MNKAQQKTKFETSEGTMLALKGMSVTGVLRNAFAVIETVQTYRNDETTNIEATYTFPLPVEATLLHLSVRLNEKLLLGRVTERAKAEREYEEAVASGDTAVMLEQVEPGLYTMNVGNLLAGEHAEVTLRYALPLKWEGDQLRLALPTTIAPRYGDQIEAGVQPHQVPSPDVMTEHVYALALRVLGQLSEAEISSPSHSVSARQVEQGIELAFSQGRAFADRDLVISLRSKAGPMSAATVVPDGEGFVAHAAIRIPERQAQQPVVLKILVDCSGSMAGDSIALAKAGALHALNCLQIGDRFSVSAFGSTVEHDPRFKGMLMPGGVDPTIPMASGYVARLDAKMGGTEMLQALEAVFALNKTSDDKVVEGGEVLLITDGETWDRNSIVQACRKSGHRVFVIGIGASPAEAVVREVAESTGGAAAFVSPREEITPVVERHLQRMRVPRVTAAEFTLPGECEWQSPAALKGCVFPGDTLHVFCGLKSAAEGAARLAVTFADGTSSEVQAAIERVSTSTVADSDMPRIAAASRIREALFQGGEERQDELTALAVKHQIITPFTNYILVHLRGEDAAKAMPELRQVPNMLAAGWGGAGSVRESRNFFECRVAACQTGGSLSWDDEPVVAKAAASAHQDVMFSLSEDALNIPAFLRNQDDSEPMAKASSSRVMFSRRAAAPEPSPAELIRALNPTFTFFSPEKQFARTLTESRGLIGIPTPVATEVIDGLQALIDLGWSEEEVLIAFWMALLSSSLDTLFSRAHRRGILRAARQTPASPALVQWISQAIAASTESTWSWAPSGEMPAAKTVAAMP